MTYVHFLDDLKRLGHLDCVFQEALEVFPEVVMRELEVLGQPLY